MRTLLRTALVLFVIAITIQAVPVTRDNPPVTGTVDAPTPIAATLRRACFDCHSNETVWPWYSRVAPASWLVARDVHEGRQHLNFSTWTSLNSSDRRKIAGEIAEEVEKGAMPPGIYTPLHPEARLSLQDISAVVAWAKAQGQLE
ncbi:MAG: heme-binding domain-containing protein [Vicinamibacterales bacterium]